MRSLILVLFAFPVAALALGEAPSAQMRWPVEEAQKRHVKVVRAERTVRFLAAWRDADEARREAAVGALQAARAAGTPPERAPDLAALGHATRLLVGEPAERAAAERAGFLDRLDFQVWPGAFAAAAPEDVDSGGDGQAPQDAPGQALRVRAYRLEPDLYRGPVRLRLVWEGPDGASLPARSEPFRAADFDTPGLDLFVRAPRAEPGMWSLVPFVQDGELWHRGSPVPVACIADLDAKKARLMEHPWPWAEVDVPELLERGLRIANGSPPSVWIDAALAEGRTDRPAAAPLPGYPDGWHAFGVARAEDTSDVDDRPVRRLVVLVRTEESAAGFFALPEAAGWIDWAQTAGVELVALEVEPGEAAALRARLLREIAAGDELWLLARGDASWNLPWILRGGLEGLRGLVRVTASAPRVNVDVPGLVVTEISAPGARAGTQGGPAELPGTTETEFLFLPTVHAADLGLLDPVRAFFARHER